MAKDSSYNQIFAELNNGINIDVDPAEQPKGSRRYTLNTVEKSSNGQFNLSNEPSNITCDSFPSGYIPVGDRYIGNNETFVILVNPDTNSEDLGIIDARDKYISYVNTNVLNIPITNQCDIKFRVRRGNERVVYWTNGYNNARTFNLDRPYNFYNTTYQEYLRTGGDPTSFIGEKWDSSTFELIKLTGTIPTFNDVEILEYGSIEPGSYNFTIQLVDEDLNPTYWIVTSNPVRIFNDSLDSTFANIRGSRNIDTTSQSFPRANKTIKLTIGNLDINFPYYRVGIIKASGGTGSPNEVLVSDLMSTANSTFIYSGNDSELTKTSLDEVLIEKEVIYAPQHCEQIENTFVLLNGQGKNINWCDFQKYASKIRTDLVTQPVILNSALSAPNVKSAKSTFQARGYMPGEVYSFGIHFIFNDGYVSPAFHIPGKNIHDTGTSMTYHELSSHYLDIHNCASNDYWGVDYLGQTLTGKPVRHHKFPTRKAAGKPIVNRSTNTTNINKYRLSLVITLNPAHTPSPGYPVDGSSNPLVIPYIFTYQVHGATNTASYSGSLVDTDIGTTIVLYDDTVALDTISGSYAVLDPSSPLGSYMTGTNDTFIITPTYTSYVASTVQNTDTSDTFGISFSNITRPHPDVVGFYIVRNERLDEDRVIVDNGVFGAMTKSSNYKSAGLLMPKQFYTANNCGTTNDSGKTVQFCNDALWFFSPEYQYQQKKINFESINIEGRYNETSYNMPTISDVTGSTCNSGHSKGIYINDVQAGTSYDPSINKAKNKDDDGFDLIVGYRNTEVGYTPNTTGLTLPSVSKTVFLAATAYQNNNADILYNTSVDNKMGICIPSTTFDTSLIRDNSGNTTKLLYGSMVRTNTTSYSNFMSRPYYREHNNMVSFGNNNIINGFNVYNGDAEISATNIVSSLYYDMVLADRSKKNSLWKIIVGGVLLVAGIALAFTGVGLGLTVAAVTALSSAAISYGVSLAVSGIKMDQFQSMVQTDYEKGLKDCVTDGGVYECVREQVETEDDTIRWFVDRVSNIYIESTIPFGLRSGLTCGVTDFIDSPQTYDENLFRSYITEKLTSVDPNQGSGRLYRGFASAEIYDMNADYMRFNKEKIYFHLPIEYDCCFMGNEIFPRRLWWSSQSFQEEQVDNYRSFLPNNYIDIEGEHGEITGCYRMGSNLFIQTREGTWQVVQHQQERVTNEVVSFIGTGSLFDIMPRIVVDDAQGSFGTLHKFANLKTKIGVFVVSEPEHKIFLHSSKIDTISDKGILSYCNENIKTFLAEQLYNLLGVEFTNINNTSNINGVGYISVFDAKFNRVVFTKKDYLLLDDKIDSLGIVFTIPISGDTDFVFCTADQKFYLGNTVIPLTNKDYFEDKSFTISFSLNTQRWVSWHSYLPNFYFHSKERMYSYNVGSDSLLKHNIEGSYHTFAGVYYPHIIEGVLPINNISNQTFEDMTLQTRALSYLPTTKQFIDKKLITFNKLTIYNETQNSGEYLLYVKENNTDKVHWYSQQIQNIIGGLTIERKEVNWYINGFRDYTKDYDLSVFSSNWDDIKTVYPIDKVVVSSNIDYRKKWNEIESFRGKYIIFRLKLDNFDNINLITNYLLTTILNSD